MLLSFSIIASVTSNLLNIEFRKYLCTTNNNHWNSCSLTDTDERFPDERLIETCSFAYADKDEINIVRDDIVVNRFVWYAMKDVNPRLRSLLLVYGIGCCTCGSLSSISALGLYILIVSMDNHS